MVKGRWAVRRLGALTGAALVWGLAFPNFLFHSWGNPLFGLLAPALLLLATRAGRPGRVFLWGYCAGLLHYLSSVYWILHIPYPPMHIPGWLALGGYCALYPAVWVWACWRLWPGEGNWADNFASADSHARLVWALNCAGAWVGLEMLRTVVVSGFPWNLLGVSQHGFLPLAQFASVFGVYGISFLLVFGSMTLLGVCQLRRRLPSREWVPATGALVLVAAWGGWAMSRSPEERGFIRFALVQPAIPQLVKDHPGRSFEMFRTRTLRLTDDAVQDNRMADVIVWPETATPHWFLQDGMAEPREALLGLARDANLWMIIGSAVSVPKTVQPGGGMEVGDYLHYNSSLLISREGKITGRYDKIHTVMFGEYAPLEDYLPFMKKILPWPSLTRGRENRPFDLRGAKVANLICYEDVFGEEGRRAAQPGVDILVNLTNDGWFGESAQQWQHAVNAAFRAIETRRPLVRCTNNGLSCWVDRHGRLHGVYFEEGDRDIYRHGYKIVKVPLVTEETRTIYQRVGDVFGWGCVAWLVGALAWHWRARKGSATPPARA